MGARRNAASTSISRQQGHVQRAAAFESWHPAIRRLRFSGPPEYTRCVGECTQRDWTVRAVLPQMRLLPDAAAGVEGRTPVSLAARVGGVHPELFGMYHMICRVRVESFDKWKAVFDSHADAQRASGLHVRHVLRNLDDPSEVFMFFDVTDLEQGRRFVSAPNVEEAKKASGVVDRPEVFFLS